MSYKSSPSLKIEVVGSSITFSAKSIPSEFKANFKFETDNPNDASLMPMIINSSLFSEYLLLYTKTKSLKLNSITFKEIKISNDEIDSIKIAVDTTDKNGNLIENYELSLLGHSIYVLVLMRLRDSPKDLCVLMKVSRPNLAKQDFFELPEGKFDENEKFVGAAADLMSELLELSLNKSNLINLTELAFGDESNGISTSKTSDQRFSLYLHRCNVSASKVKEYEEKINKKSYNNADTDKTNDKCYAGLSTLDKCVGMQIKLVPLGDAWRSTTDCKAINAIFLVHELRYHRLMPKFRSTENGYGIKKSAKFSKISALEPTSVGINLKLKVAKPIEMLSEKTRRDGKVQREATILVGDDDGVIMLKLNQEQANEKYEVGMPLILRNAKVDMENGHMVLSVDRWGKIDTNVDGYDDFDFVVLESNNVSAVEFELVLLKNDASENNNASPEHTSTSTRNQGRNNYAGRAELPSNEHRSPRSNRPAQGSRKNDS